MVSSEDSNGGGFTSKYTHMAVGQRHPFFATWASPQGSSWYSNWLPSEWSMEKVRKNKGRWTRQKSRSFCNPISEMTSCHFYWKWVLKSTTLKEGDYTMARVPGVEVMGAILETTYHPLTCLLCSRTGSGVFSGVDVKARLLVTEDLKDSLGRFSSLISHIWKNVYFTRALRGRQGRDVQPHFQVCKFRLRQVKVQDSAIKGGRDFQMSCWLEVLRKRNQTYRKKDRTFSCCTQGKARGNVTCDQTRFILSSLFYVLCSSLVIYPQVMWSHLYQALCESELESLFNSISTFGFSQFSSPGEKPWPQSQGGPSLARPSVHKYHWTKNMWKRTRVPSFWKRLMADFVATWICSWASSILSMLRTPTNGHFRCLPSPKDNHCLQFWV